MIRHVAVLAFALCLTSASAGAQTVYTLKETVEVHKSATTTSPVIGHAPRGRAIELTRDVGDWAQVVWADAPDHTGYIRVRFGTVPLAAFRDLPSIATTTPVAARATATSTADAPAAIAVASAQPAAAAPVAHNVRARDPIPYELPPHTAGFGMRMDPRFREFGGAARIWSPYRFGAQLDVTRWSITSALAAGSLTTWEFAPAVLYALPDVASSSLWVRPYVGTGLDLTRSTFRSITPGVTGKDTAFGTKVFAGGELTFSGAPQVTVSLDLGYHWLESSFNAFELGGVRATVAAHWYVK